MSGIRLSLTAALAVAALAAGCGTNRGLALDVTIAPSCVNDGNVVDHVLVDVQATPPVHQAGGSSSFTIAGSELFAVPGRSNRIVILLPQNVLRADVRAQAFDARGALIGFGEKSFAFAKPTGAAVDTLVLGNANCPAPVDGGDVPLADFAVPSDLGALDLAVPTIADLARPSDLADDDGGDVVVTVTSVEARGALGGLPYEGEGSQSPANAGVAILIHGSGLLPSTIVASGSTQVVFGSVHVSADNQWLATSVSIGTDQVQNAGSTSTVPFTVGNVSTSFMFTNLNFLASSKVEAVPSGTPIFYSHVMLQPTDTWQFNGSSPAYVWVPGLVTVGMVDTFAGGFPGCLAGCNTVSNGPGVGGASANTSLGGGGAGFLNVGAPSAGGVGGGAAYGDPTGIGLVGGSGGGHGGAVSGGFGGGVVRIQAGQIAIPSGAPFIRAYGENGHDSNGLNGSGGGGSGGLVLLQAQNGVSAGSVLVPGGGGGVCKNTCTGGKNGGGGSVGRIRIDVGTTGAAPPAAGLYGAMIAADFPTAFSTPPTTVDVVCGSGNTNTFHVELDGITASLDVPCSAAGAPARMAAVPLTVPVTAGGTHMLCTRVLSMTTATPKFTGFQSEDLSCRAIAVAGP